MNSLSIVKLIQAYIIESNCPEEFEINNLYDQIQEQEINSVVFLKITEKYNSDYFLKHKLEKILYITTTKCGFGSEVVIRDEHFLEVKKIVADIFYPTNSHGRMIGVTGTNGKTSTAYYANQILAKNSLKTLYIGTIGFYEGETYKGKSVLTTPSYLSIRKLLAQNYDVFIFEVSSHALAQKRFYGLDFDFTAWTSFSQDHLDYHGSMEEYFKAKLLILDLLKKDGICFVYEKEVSLSEKLKKHKQVQIVPKIQDFENYFSEANKTLAYNLAKSVLPNLEVDLDKLSDPPGRYERFSFLSNEIIIDFAHTPEALEKLLHEVTRANQTRDILCIFGCGGDRDKSKRSLMGAAVSKYANLAIITEDNNRSEKFQAIVKDIIKGTSIPYKTIEFREDAIKDTCFNSKNSVIVIAGKGHEDTIDRNGVKYPFNDRTYIQELIDAN